MMDNSLRQVKDGMFSPVVRQIGVNISPLVITLAAGGVGLLAAYTGWQGIYLVGLGLWLANRALDGLDGAVARATGRQSDLGGYADQLVDFVVYAVIPLGLVMRQPSLELLTALAFMLGTFYVNSVSFLYLAAILERRGQGARPRGELTSVTMPRGLIEGAETIVAYSLFFLFPHALALLFLVFGSLVIFTTLQRIVWAYHNLE
jgi:phosphatidylglycerophosphate synthase